MRIAVKIETTRLYIKRLSRIASMFPVGADSFYSREQHNRRVIRISEEIRSRYFPHLSFHRVMELSSRHDLGRMPFAHYLEIFLKRNGFAFIQHPYQIFQMIVSGVSPALVRATKLLHDTSELHISNVGFSDENGQIAEFTEDTQIARLVYYADKITGFIEDIVLGYKLGYFDSEIPEGIEMSENGLPWGFLQAFSIDDDLVKKICDCSMHKFSNIVVEIAWKYLLTLEFPVDVFEKIQKFEAIVFRLNQMFRKAIMEPIIFVKQREDIDYDYLCREIFEPVIAYLMKKYHGNKQEVMSVLQNMDEDDFLNLAVRELKLEEQVNRFKRRLKVVQSRWKPDLD